MSRLHLAVIGAGYWGTKLIREYIRLSQTRTDIELRGISDASPERLHQIAKQFTLPPSMLKTDYHDILADPTISGVHIATPNPTHYDIATEAVAANKHILLEKPMCLRSSDAFKLARAAEKGNIVLLIGHIFRFSNAVNTVKHLLETGEINHVRCVEMRWTSLMSPPPGRDIIFDLAPHPVDILNHIFEEWPTQVYVKAHSYLRRTAELEEVAFATLTFPQDIIATITLSWLHHGPRERTVTLITAQNSVKTEAVEQQITCYEPDRPRAIPVERNNTIEAEITHFIGRIQHNDPPVNSALTGVMNVTVLEAMRRSLTDDRVVPVVGR